MSNDSTGYSNPEFYEVLLYICLISGVTAGGRGRLPPDTSQQKIFLLTYREKKEGKKQKKRMEIVKGRVEN